MTTLRRKPPVLTRLGVGRRFTRSLGLAASISWAVAFSVLGEEEGVPGALDVLLGPGKPSSAPVETEVVAASRGPRELPPPALEVESATKKIRDAFAKELAEVQGSLRPAGLVEDLLRMSDDSSIKSAERFAGLQIAIEVAQLGSDPSLVHQALEARASWYEDQPVLEPLLAFVRDVTNRNRGDAVTLLRTVIDVNEDAVRLVKPDVARTSKDLAVELLRRVPANSADHFRDVVQRQAAETNDLVTVIEKSAASRTVLKGTPDDAEANFWAGCQEALADNWPAAVSHFLKSSHTTLRKAAKAESRLTDAATAEHFFVAACAWWESTEDGGAEASLLDGSVQITAVRLVVARIRAHSKELYEAALGIPSGLSGLDRKLAETRVRESGTRSRDVALNSSSEPKTEVAVERTPQFDEATFSIAEEKRAELFRRLGDAIRRRDSRELPRVQMELTGIRQQWSEALHLFNRDQALPRRQEVIADILRQHPDFADGWLCETYLKILDGKREEALASFNKALDLMDRDPVRQVFCGGQYLDAADAALMLGDQTRAEKIRNTLKKRFPNDPGVLLFESRFFMDKSLFRDAKTNLEKVMKEGNDTQPRVTAEYAWLLAAAPSGSVRDPVKAADAIKRTMAAHTGPQWKAWRAQAALFAQERNWEAAIEALDKATTQAPLIFADEIERQRQKYLAREDYWIERKR